MDSLKKVKLISRLAATSLLGEVTYTETSKEVFARVASSSQEEWFTAHRDNINSTYRIIVYSFEYEGQTIVEMDGIRYAVYRTYERSKDKVELYLEQKEGI